MAWRRKPDGRPYADVFIKGKRRRLSLLKRAEKSIDDATAQLRYDALARALGKETPTANGRHIDSIPGLCAWYCHTVMPSRGNRPITAHQNEALFKRLTAFLKIQGVTTVHDLEKSPGVLDDYTVWRAGVAKPRTVNKELAALRAVLRAAYERRVIDAIPIRQWPRLKLTDRGYPEPLSRADFQRLLDRLCNNTHNRSANLYRFMAYTGCRSVDACALKWESIHDGKEPIAIITQIKTGRNVAIALSPPAIEAVRAEQGRHKTFVFTNAYGRPFTAGGVQHQISMHAKALGLKVSSKVFRQSLVSRLYDLGADDMLVRRITGHQSESIKAYRQLKRGAAHDLARQYADEMTG